ncbi:hypothetical protein BDZ91DRAFT_686781 [Kalaharituber pfeilii]|nr:hypothetical protein BDZ91DRAFT_686781 [Kalaharituber pfeilii]
MPTPSSSNYVPKFQRDPDLIQPDNYLTDGKLDKLWDWFGGAIQNKTDPQLIFVKLVNSVRKCYQGGHFSCTAESFGQGSLYTPTEFTATENVEPLQPPCNETSPEDLRASLAEVQAQVAIKEAMIDQLQDRIITMDKEREELIATKDREKNDLQLQFNSLNEKYTKQLGIIHDVEPSCITLKSAFHPDHYVQMVSDKGTVRASRSIGGWEILQLVRHGKGVVSFKSTWLRDAYLSTEAYPTKDTGWSAGWTVNCKKSCSTHEQFRIHPSTGNEGIVFIELVASPGRYLSINQGTCQVGLQGCKLGCEQLYLVVVR